jgi:tetratricopeptide (TPR) repeat protein
MTNTLDAEHTSLITIGYFDGIIDGHAHGWAYIPQSPNSRITVEILCEGEVVGFGIADQYRSDLPEAGIGDGKYMFLIPLSYELFNGKAHTLTARESKTGTLLNGGSHTLEPEVRTLSFEPVSRSRGLDILTEHLKQPEFSKHRSKIKNFIKAYRFASTMQECGQLDEALNAWTAIRQAMGDNVLCFCKIGENHLLKNNLDDALESFRAAATLDFKSYWPHLGISIAQKLLGNHIEAEDAINVSIGLNPKELSLQNLLKEIQSHSIPSRYNAMISSNHHEAAIQLLKTHLKNDPYNIDSAKKLDELTYAKSGTPCNLPGIQNLHNLLQQQRLLEIWLDDAELTLEITKM